MSSRPRKRFDPHPVIPTEGPTGPSGGIYGHGGSASQPTQPPNEKGERKLSAPSFYSFA